MDSFFSVFNASPTLAQMLLFWSGVIAFFTIFEVLTPALVSVWFVLGGIAALVAAFCGVSFQLQFIIFIASSILALAFCRPFLKIFLKVKPVATNADSFIGMKGVVLEPISNIRGEGYVKVDGLQFRAKSSQDEEIEAGSIIQVDRIEGNTLFVTKV